MTSSVKTCLLCALAVLAATPSWAYPPPRIPREQIPQDAPPQVRDLIEKLYSKDDAEAANAAIALGELGETAAPAAPFLASMMHTKHPRGPAEAKNALKRIGKAAVEPAALALQLGDHYARRNAAEVLMTLRDPRAIDPLITCYDDTSDRNVGEAIKAIGQPAIDRLLTYATDKDAGVRARATKTLGLFAATDDRASAALKTALTDAASEVRLVAITAQVGRPDKNSGKVTPINTSGTAAIITALNDSNQQVRRQAAVLLGQMRDPASASALAAHINDADPTFRRAVIQSLGAINSAEAKDAMLKLLSDKDPAIRALAATQLHSRKDADVVAALRAAASDKQPEVRERALISLAATRDDSAIAILIAAAKDSDSLVRKAAIEGLAAFGSAQADRTQSTFEAALGDADDVVRVQTLTALASFGARAHTAVLAAVTNDSPTVRRQLLNVLYDTRNGDLLAKRAGIFETLLSDPDENVRQEVVELSANSRGIIVLPSEKLRPLLKDPNWRIRHRATRLLAQLKDPAALPVVIAMLSSENDANQAFEMLPLFGADAVEPLLKAAASGSAWTRRNAVSALARIDDPRATAAVRAALQDKDAEVRQVAARAFERRADTQPIETLVQIVKTRGEWSREADQLAAAIAKDPSRLPVLESLITSTSEAQRAVAAALLGQTRLPATIPTLLTLTTDKSDQVRVAAVDALRLVRDPASTKALIGLLNADDEALQETALRSLAVLAAAAGPTSPGDADARAAVAKTARSGPDQLRWVAIESLGRLRGPDATETITEALTDPLYDVRRAAATALVDLQDRTLAPKLIPLLTDKHWYVRAEAYNALRRITGQQQIPADPAAWQEYFDKQNAKRPNKKK